MTDDPPRWREDSSTFFIEYGDLFTPSRNEQLAMLTALIPAERDDAFTAIDLGCGRGTLGGAILRAYPNAHVLSLDGSPTMLEAARATLRPFGDRATFGWFDLFKHDWLDALPSPMRCVVSSLAIHHLDGPQKHRLFRDLRERLEPSGALLIVDIVQPVNGYASRAYAAAWDTAVTEAGANAGRPDAIRVFRESKWNLFRYPDPDFDKPSVLSEQLQWLRDAGFQEVDCFWLRGGHALYGGYCSIHPR